MLEYYFSLHQFRLFKWSFFIHSTTPYIHPMLGSVVVDLLFIVTPIVGVCNCSMFCCKLLYGPSSFAIILMGKRELLPVGNPIATRCIFIV